MNDEQLTFLRNRATPRPSLAHAAAGTRAQAHVAASIEKARTARAEQQACLADRVRALMRPGVALTADEIAEQLNASVLSVRPLVTKLCRPTRTAPGLFKRTGETRPTALGGVAHVVTRADW